MNNESSAAMSAASPYNDRPPASEGSRTGLSGEARGVGNEPAPGADTAATTWLVQRRLPGVQGQNGCWNDYPPVEAHNAAEAMQKVADDEADHMLHTEFRVQPMPEFERFWPEPETTYTRRVHV